MICMLRPSDIRIVEHIYYITCTIIFPASDAVKFLQVHFSRTYYYYWKLLLEIFKDYSWLNLKNIKTLLCN